MYKHRGVASLKFAPDVVCGTCLELPLCLLPGFITGVLYSDHVGWFVCSPQAHWWRYSVMDLLGFKWSLILPKWHGTRYYYEMKLKQKFKFCFTVAYTPLLWPFCSNNDILKLLIIFFESNKELFLSIPSNWLWTRTIRKNGNFPHNLIRAHPCDGSKILLPSGFALTEGETEMWLSVYWPVYRRPTHPLRFSGVHVVH